ncbi:MAG: arginine--tRNA ligase [Candidatus Aenigmatarchaeota archaeon]
MRELEERIKEELESLLDVEVRVEVPDSMEHGDYATNACLRQTNQEGREPYKLAEETVDKLNKKKPEEVGEIEAAGQGFINFFLDRANYTEKLLEKISKEGDSYGSYDFGKDKTVVLDYSSPNVGKPMHIGHLRSTIIGDSISRILEFAGYDCVGINHLGDMGTQFGKLIHAYKEWGDEEKLEEDPVGYLLDLYVKFHKVAEKHEELEEEARQWSKRLEGGDEEAERLWEKFTKHTKKGLKKTYSRLNITFDSWKGERFYRNKTRDVIQEALDKGVAKKDEDGSIIIESDDDDTPYLIQRSDGGTLYSTRELAQIKYRKEEYGFDKALYVVGQPQERHFKKAFEAADKMGYANKNELVHVKFGMMSLPEGSLSTRTGNVILLEDVLDKAKEKAMEAIAEKNPSLENKENVAERVGVGALKYFDLSKRRTTSIKFSWEEALNFEGSSGPYLQYSYSRACGILDEVDETRKADFNDMEEVEFKLVKKLGRFHEPVFQAADKYEPHRIAVYLNELCELFNEFYHECRVKDSEHEARRIEIVKAFRQVLGNGLDLLNIPKLEEM